MTQASLYPIAHANTGRGGAVDATSSAQGRVIWSRELGGRPGTSHWPATVLVWNGLALVGTYDDLVLFDGAGKRLWERKKQGGTPVAVAADGLLYYKNTSLFIDAVDAQGKPVLKSAPFPGAMDGKVRVDAFWPRARDFIAALYERPQDEQRLQDDTPEPMLGPKLTLIRNDYPTPYGDWSTTYDAAPALKPLLLPGKSVVALMLGKQVVRVDAAEGAELSRFNAPLREPTEWSVDAQEVYALTGHEQGRKVLLAFSAGGQTLWRWEDLAENDAWAKLQPPLRAKGGRVYALTEGRVLALEAGRLLWAHDLKSELLRHGASVGDGSFEIKDGRLLAKGAVRHGTCLADGSVLVTSGKSLLHLSPEGRKLFALSLDADILSPPVVDGQGAIYVATATHLFKIE